MWWVASPKGIDMTDQDKTKADLIQKLRMTRRGLARLQMREIEITQMLGEHQEGPSEPTITLINLEEGRNVCWVPGFQLIEGQMPEVENQAGPTSVSRFDFATLTSFVHPEDVALLEEDLRAFEEGRQKAVYRRCRIHMEGMKTVWTDIYLMATDRDSNGMPVAAVCCLRHLVSVGGLGSRSEKALVSFAKLLGPALEGNSPLASLLGLPERIVANVPIQDPRIYWLSHALGSIEVWRETRSNDLFFIKDLSMRYVWVSDELLDLLGLSLGELQGRTDGQLFLVDSYKEEQRIAEAILTGAEGYITRIRRVGDKSLSFRDKLFAYPDKTNGEPQWILGECHLVDEAEAKAEPVTHSSAMAKAIDLAKKVARIDSIVLLTGETGSGKDHLAKYIHDLSPRSGNLFQVVDCAAIQDTLIESELFGYEPGGHSGATTRKKGRLELAEGGTLLLDEIGELSPGSQAKLLTYLDTKSFMRVGGMKPVKPNTRILAATKRNLEKEVSEGRFRDDLYHRLNIHPIEVPPLRNRLEDLPKLIQEVLPGVCKKFRSDKVPTIKRSDIRALAEYDWPGNVRELIAALERGLLASAGTSFSVKDALPKGFLKKQKEDSPPNGGEDDWVLPIRFPKAKSDTNMVMEAERLLIEEALRRTRGNESAAARLLGVKRGKLRTAIKRHKKIGSNEPTGA